MTYPTVDAGESREASRAVEAISAPATQAERLRAGLIVAGLTSFLAVFWIAVIRLVALV